jgi:hypothetical protein
VLELDIEQAIRRCGLPPGEVEHAVEALCGPGGEWHGLVRRRDAATLVAAADLPALLGALAAPARPASGSAQPEASSI